MWIMHTRSFSGALAARTAHIDDTKRFTVYMAYTVTCSASLHLFGTVIRPASHRDVIDSIAVFIPKSSFVGCHMSQSSMTKATHRLRRERSLSNISQWFLLLFFALVSSALDLLRGYVSRSADPFSVNSYFPGWGVHPAVFSPRSALGQAWAGALGPLYRLELGSAKTISNSSITVVLPLTERVLRLWQGHSLESSSTPQGSKKLLSFAPKRCCLQRDCLFAKSFLRVEILCPRN